MSDEFFDEQTPEEQFISLVLRKIGDPEYYRAVAIMNPVFALAKNGFTPRTKTTPPEKIATLLQNALGRSEAPTIIMVRASTMNIPVIKKSFELEYLAPGSKGQRFYAREECEQALIKEIFRKVQDRFRLNDALSVSPDARTHAQSTVWVSIYVYIMSNIVEGPGAARAIADLIAEFPCWIPLGDSNGGYIVLVNQ